MTKRFILIVLSVLLVATSANAQDTPAPVKTPVRALKGAKTPSPPPLPPPAFTLEPKAMDILKTACERLAAANTSAATASAYSAGYAAGSTDTAYAMGAIYATLPSGCTPSTISGSTYYLCGSAWMQPSYGANGVYYRVVPAP